jgi:ribonuclease E
VEIYDGKEPLFHRFGIEAEIQKIHSRHVPLPSGGSLVIESTEALVAIDVNSGKFREPSSAEETALRINLEAADEIARQLRLRDLGGVIICDFIDMRMDRNKRALEQAMRKSLRAHKEKARILRMSQFGIIEITRQRQRASIKRSIYEDCPYCRGTGQIKSVESMTLDVMRMLRLAIHHDEAQTIHVRVSPSVASHMLNRRRAALHSLETVTDKQIVVVADENCGLDQVAFECKDARGLTVEVDLGQDEE